MHPGRAMATHRKVGVGYNAQVAFDAKHKLIVEQHVTNAGSDLGLPPVTSRALAALAMCHAASGDGDRSSGSDTVKCHSPERFHTVWSVCETVGQNSGPSKIVPELNVSRRGSTISSGDWPSGVCRIKLEPREYEHFRTPILCRPMCI